MNDHRGRRGRWREAVGIPVLALGIGSLLAPHDPLLLRQPFPWLALPAMLVALRYGKTAGAVSVAVLLSSLLWAPQPAFLGIPAGAGLMFLTMLCGEYADSSVARSDRLAARCEVMEERARRLTEDLHVARISHERLEQNLIYKPLSLRGVLDILKEHMVASGGELTVDVADRLLYILNQMSGVQLAGLYRVRGRHTPVTLATLGDAGPLRVEDPVYRNARDHLHSASLADIDTADADHYLAVHVFVGPRDEGLLILAIADISFFALHRDNLLVIEAIFQYVCQRSIAIERSAAMLTEWPDCPIDFAAEYMRLSSLQARLGVGSRLLGYQVRAAHDTGGVVRQLLRLCRGADVVWAHPAGRVIWVLFLLPFAGPATVEGHIERARRVLQAHFGEDRKESWLSIADYDLTDPDPLARLRGLIASQEAA